MLLFHPESQLEMVPTEELVEAHFDEDLNCRFNGCPHCSHPLPGPGL